MGNPTLQLAKLVYIFLKFRLGVPDLMLTSHFKCLWKMSVRVREEQPALLCCVVLCCILFCSLLFSLGLCLLLACCVSMQKLDRFEVEVPLRFVRLSYRCPMKPTQNCSATAPQTPEKIPAKREMDCAQIDMHCSVRG